MIGLKKWNDPGTYYSQENNSSEQLLKKDALRDIERVKKILNMNRISNIIQNDIINIIYGYLETCGPTAALNILAARDDNINILCPGNYKPQPEDILANYLNDTRNYKKLKEIRDLDNNKWFGNEIPQYYPLAIKEVFDVDGFFKWGLTLNDIIICLKDGVGVLACLKKPGHFIGIVAYDEEKKEVVYRDPWPGNYWPSRIRGQSGFNRRLGWEELSNNLQGYMIGIGGKK